jgi:hypothetical protein
MFAEIKGSLERFRVHVDVFTNEAELHDEGLPDQGTIEIPIAPHPKDRRRVLACLHPRDVEPQQVLARSNSGPTAQLVNRDYPVVPDFQVLDGKLRVVIKEMVEARLGRAPEQEPPEARHDHATHDNADNARAGRPNLAGAQLHIQHLFAAQTTIFQFAMKEHGLKALPGQLWARARARSTIRWQSWG